jgi:hypothetical protein
MLRPMSTLNIVLLAILMALYVLWQLMETAAVWEDPNTPSPWLHRPLVLASMLVFAVGAGTLVGALAHPSVVFLVPVAVLLLALGALGLWRSWYRFRSGPPLRRHVPKPPGSRDPSR